MKKRMLPIVVLAVLVAASAAGSAVLAQTSTHYNLEWHVIGSGASPVSSASYHVNSTTGQAAAGPPYSAGAHYVVSAGYWYTTNYLAYLPTVLRAR
jgi:hypothetical protein